MRGSIYWDSKHGFHCYSRMQGEVIEIFKTDDISLLTLLNATCGNPFKFFPNNHFAPVIGDSISIHITQEYKFEVMARYQGSSSLRYLTEGTEYYKMFTDSLEQASEIKLDDVEILELEDEENPATRYECRVRFMFSEFVINIFLTAYADEHNAEISRAWTVFGPLRFTYLTGVLRGQNIELQITIPYIREFFILPGIRKLLEQVGVADKLKALAAYIELGGAL